MHVREQWKRPDLVIHSKVLVLVWGQTTCWNDSKFVSLLSNTMMIISTKFGHKWTTAHSTCFTTAPTGKKVFVLNHTLVLVCTQNFSSFGQVYLALPSQSPLLDKNFGNLLCSAGLAI